MILDCGLQQSCCFSHLQVCSVQTSSRRNADTKMASLPRDRLEPTPPFTHFGDCFGPFMVREGRREIKRYGLIMTCMASRAIHIELLDDMMTDAFINGLRCLISIRGPVQTIRCEQGTNFVGAINELKVALQEVKEPAVKKFLADNQCQFLLNTPHSSHMGGSWERHIQTIRNVLMAMLQQHGGRLDTSTLRTFLYEAMAIVNSWPLSPENLCEPTIEPLTPNHLLTIKSRIILPPPGEFEKEDVYARKRWRKTQYLAKEFWQRWRKEYVALLQPRQKWTEEKKHLHTDDIVLLKEDGMIRGHWRLGRIVETTTDDDGLVRKVKVLMGDPHLSANGKRVSKQSVLERPIHKLVLLLKNRDN